MSLDKQEIWIIEVQITKDALYDDLTVNVITWSCIDVVWWAKYIHTQQGSQLQLVE